MKSAIFTINSTNYEIKEKHYDPISGDYIIPFVASDTTSWNETNHYYPAELTLTDDDDNVLELDDTDETYGEYLRLRVRETTAPDVTLISPQAEAGVINISGHSITLTFTVTDAGDSGLDDDSIQLQFGDNTYGIEDEELTVTEIDNGYQIEFSPTVYLSDGEYDVYLTASDNDDNTSQLLIRVIVDEAGFNLIWNRTQSDVNRVIYLRDKIQTGTATVAEHLEYAHDLKGARNRSDFERILGAVEYICAYYEVPVLSTLQTLPEIPRRSYISTLLLQLSAMKLSCPIHATTPLVPTLPINTYQKMNDIEKILYDMITIIKSKFYYYCDAGLYADGEIGLLE